MRRSRDAPRERRTVCAACSDWSGRGFHKPTRPRHTMPTDVDRPLRDSGRRDDFDDRPAFHPRRARLTELLSSCYEASRRAPEVQPSVLSTDLGVGRGPAFVDSAQGSRENSLVPLEGLEPPTLSLGRNCSSIELQRLTTPSYPAAVPPTGGRPASRRGRAWVPTVGPKHRAGARSATTRGTTA